MAKVKVGCKLPHGLTMELGLNIDKFSNISKSDNYQRVTLAGTNQNLIQGAPATRVQAPGITLVEENYIDEWLKKNRNLSFVKAGMIYKIANEAEGQAIALDLASQTTGFEPLDPTKAPKDISKDIDAGGGGRA